MTTYILRRLLWLPLVLFVVSLLVFVAMHLAPGDPVDIKTQQLASEEAMARLRIEWGLDRPMHLQFLTFLSYALRGDLGRSFAGGVSVTEQIAARFPATVELAVAALFISTVVGIPLGIVSAIRSNSVVDYAGRVFALLGISIPLFWFGIIMIIVFGVTLQWLPVSGRYDARTLYDLRTVTNFYLIDSVLNLDANAFTTTLRHLVMPAMALGLWSVGIITRMTRACMLNVLALDYVRTARSKGLIERIVVMRHCLPNAMLPVITLIGLQFGANLGGAVITETVFAWPGLGKLLVDSIRLRDYPQVQGSVLVLASAYVFINLAVDILYAYLDPRIRYGRE
ncbi:MAG: ABC transporter permease [Chloroflexi bacterium]|nr:ABC transporter permease [Chloroflexota bacterium]MCL5074061.1 ABC transporter permease [Chloroflexota bacterium]